MGLTQLFRHFNSVLLGGFLFSPQHSNTYHSRLTVNVFYLLSATRLFHWPLGLPWYLTYIMWPYLRIKHTDPKDGCNVSLGNTDNTTQFHIVPPLRTWSAWSLNPFQSLKSIVCKVVVAFYSAVSSLRSNKCDWNVIHLCRFLLRASDVWCNSVNTRVRAFSTKEKRPALLDGQCWQQ